MNLFLSRFRGLLEECGKLQKEICADLGIRNQKLSNWKTGYSEPNFDDIIMLANYFDVSTDYLLGLENDLGTKKYSPPIKNAGLSPDVKELVELYQLISSSNQLQILEYVRFIAEREHVTKKRNL